jgi:hypothetical protein
MPDTPVQAVPLSASPLVPLTLKVGRYPRGAELLFR